MKLLEASPQYKNYIYKQKKIFCNMFILSIYKNHCFFSQNLAVLEKYTFRSITLYIRFLSLRAVFFNLFCITDHFMQ